ncbi:MAG: hypothetical protein AAB555_03290 [Patescibacteria group bacterium]
MNEQKVGPVTVETVRRVIYSEAEVLKPLLRRGQTCTTERLSQESHCGQCEKRLAKGAEAVILLTARKKRCVFCSVTCQRQNSIDTKIKYDKRRAEM